MTIHLTPLEVCERLIGDPATIAGPLGYGRTAPFQWRHPSKNRDAGDLPSARVMRSLLAHAAARGIPLTAEHLIWGADAEAISKLDPRRVAAE